MISSKTPQKFLLPVFRYFDSTVNRFDNHLLLLQTKLYIEDWIGLRTLDEAGKVKFVSVAGNHLGISKEDMKKHIVPYLTSQDSRSYNYKIKYAHGRPKPSNSLEFSSKGSSIYNRPFVAI